MRRRMGKPSTSLATLACKRSFSAARVANSLTACTKGSKSVTGRPKLRVQAISFWGVGCSSKAMQFKP